MGRGFLGRERGTDSLAWDTLSRWSSGLCEGTMCVCEMLWDSLWKKEVRKAPKLDDYPSTLSMCSSRQSSH